MVAAITGGVRALMLTAAQLVHPPVRVEVRVAEGLQEPHLTTVRVDHVHKLRVLPVLWNTQPPAWR